MDCIFIPKGPFCPQMGRRIYVEKEYHKRENLMVLEAVKSISSKRNHNLLLARSSKSLHENFSFSRPNFYLHYLPYEEREAYFFLSDDEYLDFFSPRTDDFYRFLDCAIVGNIEGLDDVFYGDFDTTDCRCKHTIVQCEREITINKTDCNIESIINSGFIVFSGIIYENELVFFYFPFEEAYSDLLIGRLKLYCQLYRRINSVHINGSIVHSPSFTSFKISDFYEEYPPDKIKGNRDVVRGKLSMNQSYTSLIIDKINRKEYAKQEPLCIDFTELEAALYWFFLNQTKPLSMNEFSWTDSYKVPKQGTKPGDIFQIYRIVGNNPNNICTLIDSNIRVYITRINQKIQSGILKEFAKEAILDIIQMNLIWKCKNRSQLDMNQLSSDDLRDIVNRLGNLKRNKKNYVSKSEFAKNAIKIAITTLEKMCWIIGKISCNYALGQIKNAIDSDDTLCKAETNYDVLKCSYFLILEDKHHKYNSKGGYVIDAACSKVGSTTHTKTIKENIQKTFQIK